MKLNFIVLLHVKCGSDVCCWAEHRTKSEILEKKNLNPYVGRNLQRPGCSLGHEFEMA